MLDPNWCNHGRNWWDCEPCAKAKGRYIRQLGRCDDCIGPEEIFMVHDSVWCDEARQAKLGRRLCIPCLEGIIARPLVPEDFTDAMCNRRHRLIAEAALGRIRTQQVVELPVSDG